jgi:hypothetical protein
MLIVEGPDNAGKSTLIGQIKETFNIESIHAGGPPKNLRDIETRRAAAFKNCLIGIVQDRNYLISDIVYGSVLRKSPCYNNFRLLLQMLQLKPLVIYCRPRLEQLLEMKNHEVKAHETQEHVDSVVENQKTIVEHYDELMKIVGMHTTVLTYDYNKGFPEYQIKTIENHLTRKKDFYERTVVKISQ